MMKELINKQMNKLMLKVWKQPWEVHPYYSKIRLARDNKPRWLETDIYLGLFWKSLKRGFHNLFKYPIPILNIVTVTFYVNLFPCGLSLLFLVIPLGRESSLINVGKIYLFILFQIIEMANMLFKKCSKHWLYSTNGL